MGSVCTSVGGVAFAFWAIGREGEVFEVGMFPGTEADFLVTFFIVRFFFVVTFFFDFFGAFFFFSAMNLV